MAKSPRTSTTSWKMRWRDKSERYVALTCRYCCVFASRRLDEDRRLIALEVVEWSRKWSNALFLCRWRPRIGWVNWPLPLRRHFRTGFLLISTMPPARRGRSHRTPDADRPTAQQPAGHNVPVTPAKSDARLIVFRVMLRKWIETLSQPSPWPKQSAESGSTAASTQPCGGWPKPSYSPAIPPRGCGDGSAERRSATTASRNKPAHLEDMKRAEPGTG